MKWNCPNCTASIELSSYLISRMRVMCIDPVLECEYCGEYVQVMLSENQSEMLDKIGQDILNRIIKKERKQIG